MPTNRSTADAPKNKKEDRRDKERPGENNMKKPTMRLIVMAAGQSRRFGRNKLLYNFNGRPMYMHVLKLLSAFTTRYPDVAEVIVVSAWPEIIDSARELGFIPVLNLDNGLGLSHTIKLGLRCEYCEDFDISVFFTADQPFFKYGTLEAFLLKALDNPDKIICVKDDKRTGNPVSFPASMTDDLCNLTGDAGGKAVMRRHHEQVIYFPVDPEELLDIDYQKDLPDQADLPLWQVDVLPFGSPEYGASMMVRDHVLRRSLNTSIEQDDLSDEVHRDWVMGTMKDGRLVGMGTLHPMNDEVVDVRYIAVEEPYQNQGAGSAILRELERIAKMYGFKRIELNSRETSIRFFQKWNYKVVSEPFRLEFPPIELVRMAKDLVTSEQKTAGEEAEKSTASAKTTKDDEKKANAEGTAKEETKAKV